MSQYMLTISVPFLLPNELGVFPYLFGALGLSANQANVLTILLCPLHAA